MYALKSNQLLCAWKACSVLFYVKKQNSFWRCSFFPIEKRRASICKASIGQVCCPEEADYLPERKAHNQGYRETHQIRWKPHSKQIKFIFWKVRFIAINPIAEPYRRIDRITKDAGFEGVISRQIYQRQNHKIQCHLGCQGCQTRSVPKLVHPWLTGEFLNIKQFGKDVDLIKVLKSSLIKGTKQAK